MSGSWLRRLRPFVLHPSELVVVVAMLALALGAIVVLGQFREREEASERGQLELAVLQKRAAEVRAVSWEIATDGAHPEAVDRLAGVLDRSERTLATVLELGAGDPVLTSAEAWRELRVAVEQSRDLAQAGDARAATIHEEKVEARLARFNRRVGQANTYFVELQEDADRVTELGTAGAVLLSALASAIVAVLVARRRASSEAAARAELAAHNARLRELDGMKDEFIALVSHELRTPLTSIRGYLELVMDGHEELTDDQQQLLAVVARNVRRLERLVGDLLFAAQIEAGRLSFDWEEVEAPELIEDALAAARPVAEGKEITLSAGFEGGLTLIGDRARLGQVLDNLVMNALKFTPAGGAVSIEARTEDDGIAFGVRRRAEAVAVALRNGVL